MKDNDKTKAQLIVELAELRKRITEFESVKTKCKKLEEEEALRKFDELVEIHANELIRINEQLINEINEHKKTAETLQSKKDELQLVLDSSPIMIFYKDRDGRFILANEALTQALGKPKEEIEGRLLSELLPKEQEEQMDADDLEVMESEKPKIGIIEAYESPKGTKWSRTSKVPLKDDKGDIIGIVGFGEDVTEWKKADKELRQKTAEQEALLSSIPVYVYYKDTESRLIFANRAFAEMVNTPVEQLTGKDDYDFFPKEQAETFQNVDKKVMESGKPLMNIEEQFTDAEGRTKWASTSKIPYFDENEKVIGMVGITMDITDRKKAEEAINTLFKSTVGSGKDFFDGIVSNLCEWLETECAIIGQIIDGNRVKVLSMQVDGEYIQDYTYLLAGSPCYNVAQKGFCVYPENICELFHEDKVIVELGAEGYIGTPLNDKNNVPIGILCAISRHKLIIPHRAKEVMEIIAAKASAEIVRERAEEEMKESQKYSKNIIDSSLDMIISVDKGRRIVEFNKAAMEMFGYSKEEIIGKHVNILYADPAEGLNVHKTTRRLGQLAGEILNKRKNGDLFSSFLSSSILENEEGDFMGIMGVSRDITERKQLEEERMKTEKLESIGILAGGIAHDFNNILAAVLSNISLAKISIDDKKEVVELLTSAEKITFHAKDLTQQLLTFAKGGAPIKETTELTELIRETARFSLRGSNVHYRTSITPDLCLAEVDKGQINQALSNLIINAQQSMPDGGIISINAENATQITLDNLPIEEGNYIKISISDKGIGVPADHLKKIFDPYFTTKQKGSGLGLATTYSIIKRHNGHITAESEIGVGTTFHIYLPVSSEQIEKKEEIKKEPAVIKGKILLMDDEPEIRKIVSKRLTRDGSEVDVASNGTEAIKLYKEAMDSGKPFDVVIMDLTIPGGMGGKRAIKKLLEIDPDVKAVVSSGYADDPVVSNFWEYGFKDKISKPYKPEELKEVLNKVINQKND